MQVPGGGSVGTSYPSRQFPRHFPWSGSECLSTRELLDADRLQSHLILGALPSAVPCARLHTRHILWEWGLQPLTDQAELIVSELITNAVHASEALTASRYAGRWAPGRPPVRLWLHGQQQHIAIQVWDANNQPPARQPTDPDAESGRGLLLVESLTAAWGSYRLQRSSGKITWAILQ